MENWTFGIDISHHNRIKWEEIPDYVRVVIVKATEGIGYEDPMFKEHTEKALEAGKIVFLYHFYRTLVGGIRSDPVKQAAWFTEAARQYWPDVKGRANDVERGPVFANGVRYNPAVSTIESDLESFHKTLHFGEWDAFDLMYTNVGTWAEWGLHGANGGRGPQWIIDKPYLEGLWLAWHPASQPKNESMIQPFLDKLPLPNQDGYLARPFTEYIIWQPSSKFEMPGSYTAQWLPKPIDFNIIPYSETELKNLIGDKQTPEPPPAGSVDERLTLLESKIHRQETKFYAFLLGLVDLVGKTIDGEPPTEEPPTEEPPTEEPNDWRGWQDKPRAEWPKGVKVGDQTIPVGYIQINPDRKKTPLLALDSNRVPYHWQSETLRPWSNKDNIDSMRIICKGGDWVMVAATGDDYHFGEPRPYGENIDGDGVYYKVMHEQNIDGVKLWEVGDLPNVYIDWKHTNPGVKFIP